MTRARFPTPDPDARIHRHAESGPQSARYGLAYGSGASCSASGSVVDQCPDRAGSQTPLPVRHTTEEFCKSLNGTGSWGVGLGDPDATVVTDPERCTERRIRYRQSVPRGWRT